MSKKNKSLDKEALSFHSNGRPGKLEISATKPDKPARPLAGLFTRRSRPLPGD